MSEIAINAAKTVFDKSLLLATLVGAISIPITVVLTLISGIDGVSITAVLLASLLVGHLYADLATSARRAGAQVGLIGGIPTIWETSEMFEVILSGRLEFALIAAVFIPVSIIFTLGISILGSILFAIIGEWLSKTVRVAVLDH